MVGTGEGITGDNQETAPNAAEPNTLAQNEAPVADEKDIVSNKSSIIIANKRAMNIYYRAEEYIKKYSDMVNQVADTVDGTAKVYALIAPTSIEMYGTKTYRTGVHSQREGIETAYRYMNEKVVTIDAYSSLVRNTDEYIYFRTDHHWTARGAYLGYAAFCESAGLTPVPLNVLASGRLENFVGTFYGYTYSQILKDHPDYVEYFLPRCSCEGMAYTSAERTDGWKFDVVNPNITASNKYMAFIAGDQPLEVIRTSNHNGKKIMVIKESYGNALVPFLCDNYQEIYVVDPRSVQFNLPDFLEENGIGELLFVNYTFSISNTEYINKVNAMLTYTKS